MSPKKFHEVDTLCPLLEQIGRNVGSKRVIDLGCGQGYLCNVLALCCDVEVLGIDSVATQVAGAERKLKNIQKDVRLMIRKGVNLDSFVSLEPTVKYVEKPVSCSMTATVRTLVSALFVHFFLHFDYLYRICLKLSKNQGIHDQEECSLDCTHVAILRHQCCECSILLRK
jgi:SAM-dependent methyltransferase